MKIKIFVISLFAVFFFFAEIIFSYSNKKDSTQKSDVEMEVVPISHRLINEISDYEQTEGIDQRVANFLVSNQINGASVAIANKGKLVYAKGFGYANMEKEEPVEPKHMFRIASVSKLITAVAIMKLHEEGKLSMYDPVFGKNGILNNPEYGTLSDPLMKKITVYHLLVHTSGWSTRKGDPVFMPLSVARSLNIEPPVSAKHLIQYAINQPLDNKPGKRYDYSNLGYIILGEIVEKVSGMPYEDYVKFALLEPLGIYDMRIGKNFKDEKFSNEVSYYDKSSNGQVYSFDGSGHLVPQAYGGNNIELLGAAGGWIASAVELMKFMVAIDGFDDERDILKPETIELMTDASIHGSTLIGWKGTDGHGNWWRTGTLSGTSALVLRQHNNINWIMLLNTTTKRRSRIHSDISRLMFSSVATVTDWPDEDLFDFYEPKVLHAQIIE